MSIWAIVPVKPLRRGKSRLAGILSEDERTALNHTFLENVLETLKQTPEIAQTLVVSRDPAALAVAREFDARTVLEDGNPDLNMALQRATVLARAMWISGVLILPADLPLLQVSDLQEVFSSAKPAPSVTIVPDRHESGTNAMLIKPCGLIKYHYGADSFQHHCELARQAGGQVTVVQNPNIALDVDTPADMEYFNHLLSGDPKPQFSISKQPFE